MDALNTQPMPPAVILCGGRGSRLREKTEYVPKPMVEVGGRPLLWHIMKLYAHFGVSDFVICAGYRADYIFEYFMQYRYLDGDVQIDMATGTVKQLSRPDSEDLNWNVTIANTGLETLTGLRVGMVRKYINHDRFFLTYGDGLSDLNIRDLLSMHVASGKKATITGVRPSSRFGELSVEQETVTSFRQKPQVTQGWVNGGFMVVETDSLSHLPDQKDVAIEEGYLAPLSRDKEVGIFRHSGFWQCMDTYREMELLENLWQGGNPPWKLW